MKPITVPPFAFCIALVAPLLVASCSSLPPPETKDKEPTPMVSGLIPGQSLEVDYQSTGCFHHVAYHIKIIPQGDGYLVTGSSPASSSPHNKKNERPKDTPLHAIKLSQRDAIKLDRLIEFYRHVPTGGCTTSDTISLQLKTGTKTITRATFTDETCDTYDRPELLTIPTLVQRMKSKP